MIDRHDGTMYGQIVLMKDWNNLISYLTVTISMNAHWMMLKVSLVQ